jgi:Na+-transporting NADH:ubiquinone oxidoreductase subunit NqrB
MLTHDFYDGDGGRKGGSCLWGIVAMATEAQHRQQQTCDQQQVLWMVLKAEASSQQLKGATWLWVVRGTNWAVLRAGASWQQLQSFSQPQAADRAQ